MPRIITLSQEELKKLTTGNHTVSPELLAIYEPLLKPLKKGQSFQVVLEPNENRARVKADLKKVATHLGMSIIFRQTRGDLIVADYREPTADEKAEVGEAWQQPTRKAEGSEINNSGC